MLPLIEISEDEFCDKYAPEEDENGDLYVQRYLFDEADRTLLLVAEKEHRLWTVVEGDRGRSWYVLNGFHRVNRLCHIITSVPYEAGVDIEVEWPWLAEQPRG